MQQIEILTAVNMLITQAGNGYYMSELEIAAAEEAIDTLQNLVIKAKSEQA